MSEATKAPVPAESGDTFAFPLSSQERSLWTFEELGRGKPVYNVPRVIRLRGALNVDALRAALSDLAERHEILRSHYGFNDGEPARIVTEGAVTIPLRMAEATGDGDEALQRALDLAAEEIRTPFQLAKAPLMRALLISIDSEDHFLVLTLHHIIADAWSVGIVLDELVALYNGHREGKASSLPELSIQYADYAIWQEQDFGADKRADLASYWREQLAGVPNLLELPADRPRPAEQSYEGGAVELTLPRELAEGLRAVAREEKTTLFVVLLAGLSALFHRYTGDEDIVIGCPTGGREQPELESSVGFYADTALFRTSLKKRPSFRDLLARVRETSLATMDRRIPFEVLVEELNAPRNLAHSPLFQVMFALQTIPGSKAEFTDLKSESIFLHTDTSKFDLELELTERDGGLSGFFEYNTDIFDRWRIERMVGHFRALLTSAIEKPDAPVDTLPLLTEAERVQLLDEWNRTDEDYPKGKCIHELFAEQALRSPGKVAVRFGSESVTYQELNERADSLARFLRSEGAEPGQIVGIYLERSLNMLVSVLGVLKSGAAYLPLDTAYPADRLRYMVSDAKVLAVLTDESTPENLPAEVRCIAVDEADRSTEDGEMEGRSAGASDLAYVIYTSGSTGRPKGVQIPHKAAVNFLSTMARKPGLGAEDRLIAVTTLSFDIALLELFLPLTVGATVVLADRETAADGAVLRQLLDSGAGNVMQATPATWRLLIDSGWQGNSEFKVLVGGEALPPNLANQLFKRAGEVWNMYGPTETTVWSSVYRLPSEDARPLIGKPIGNTQLYVLDEQMQPVPAGVSGELLIGGDGLARGYLHRPELTAERFVPSPFVPSERLYRTGDLARFQPDGNVDCLGRLDFQVKVRGFRIELGEIETSLRAHEEIADAVVHVKDYGEGDHRLIAYVIYEDEEPTATELRRFLRKKLPDYMVPSAFVELDKFPLTPNGKIDRKSLPDPDVFMRESSEFQEPTTPKELMLAQIWKELLQIDRVSLTDNFFDIGGHSLLALRMVFKIREETGVDLNPRDIVLQTLGQLAARCADEQVTEHAEAVEA